MRCRGFAAALLVVSIGTGCSDGSNTEGTASAPSTTVAAAPMTFDEIRTELGCDVIPDGDSAIAPVRGGAATRAMSCPVAGARAHVFERAPEHDVAPEFEHTFQAGGSLERIADVVRGGSSVPGCDVVVAVTAGFFVVAPSTADLDQLVPLIGEPLADPLPAAPTVSYLDASCTIR